MSCEQSQLGSQFFLIRLFYSLRVSANHVPIISRNKLYLCDTWYWSLYTDVCLVYVPIIRRNKLYLCNTWYWSLYTDVCLVYVPIIRRNKL
jgi:hypothetical protein